MSFHVFHLLEVDLFAGLLYRHFLYIVDCFHLVIWVTTEYCPVYLGVAFCIYSNLLPYNLIQEVLAQLPLESEMLHIKVDS